MKSQQLHELVKNIVKQLVKEYSLLDNPPSSLNGNPSDNANAQITDPNNQLAGAMSNSDQHKLQQIKDKQNQELIKQKQAELTQKKKELEFNDKKTQQMKRFEVPQMQKTIQQLKSQH